MSYRIEAVHNLFSRVHHWDGDKFYSIDGGEIIFSSSEQKQIDDEVVRLQSEYDAQEYARNRQAEFPSIQDLVVALYDTDDKADIEAKRAAVKLKYPKPE